MLLPNYTEIINKDTSSEIYRVIDFERLQVRIYGDAKYSRVELRYLMKPGYKRRNIDLSFYINAMNDYFVSYPALKKYKEQIVDLFDFNCVKALEFRGLKFDSDEFQIIRNKYPNIVSVRTEHCTISKRASIGCLNCNYYDDTSDIMSFDSFHGFSGETIDLKQTHIMTMNQKVLQLNNSFFSFRGVTMDYESFFLTTSAPKLRKIKILGKQILNDKDLLFISGFYNLESVEISAIVSSYEQLQKLERLREIRFVFCSNEKELEATKGSCAKTYQKILDCNPTEDQLKNYVMRQRLFLQNRFQELRHKLYVPRLERVKWENKLSTKDLESIRRELLEIATMPIVDRKDLSREKRKATALEGMHGLDFDHTYFNKEEDVLLDSRPFEGGGIKYYVKRKQLIIDK